MNKFENVKVGDRVAVYTGSYWRIETVTEVKKSTFKAGSLYWKEDGHMYGRGSWGVQSADILTPEMETRITEEERHRKAFRAFLEIPNNAWRSLKAETLETVVELVKKDKEA